MKKLFVVVMVLAMLMTSAMPAFAYGSDTECPAFTREEVAAGALGDSVIFNAITDGKIGAEQNFVGARWPDGPNIWCANSISVNPGEELLVRLYVHNDSLTETATGVAVHFSLPSRLAVRFGAPMIIGFIDVPGATPSRYWDEVKFENDQIDDFYLEYIEGSALLQNRNNPKGIALPDSIVNYGVQIGSDALDGVVAPDDVCQVIIRMRVVASETASADGVPAGEVPLPDDAEEKTTGKAARPSGTVYVPTAPEGAVYAPKAKVGGDVTPEIAAGEVKHIPEPVPVPMPVYTPVAGVMPPPVTKQS